jgi:hypothetical protein
LVTFAACGQCLRYEHNGSISTGSQPMSGDNAEDQVSNESASIGDHQRAALAGSDPEGIMTLAAAIKLMQQASEPRKVSSPPPGTKVVSGGPVMQGRYIPSVSLDPLNVKAIEGFDEHSGYVNVAVEAFSEIHVGLLKLRDARELVAKDTSRTEAQQVLMTAKEAEKLQERTARAMDKAIKQLRDGIKHNERELTKPLTAAADNSISAEVRKYVRELPDDKRMSFLNDAMKRNDVATLSAVLGVQPFLSGITHEMQAHFTRTLHEKSNPQIAERITVMRKVLDLVEQRCNLIFTEIERCLGAKMETVAKLRKASSAAEQALLLVNAPPVQS